MSENPLQALFHTAERVSSSIQTHLSRFLGQPRNPAPINNNPFFSLSPSSQVTPFKSNPSYLHPSDVMRKGKSVVQPLSKEELGRATWTFLHTLAAQMMILSRMYPCKECADHFKEVLRVNPVEAGSHFELSQWMCRVHNVVNRSLAKPVFPCQRVDARWGKLECEDRACDVLGSSIPDVDKDIP